MTIYVSPAKGATPPTQEQLGAFRAQLLEQRGFRIDQLRLLCLTRVRASRTSREVTSVLLSGARSALQDVTAALRRMDDGTFGRCTSCQCQLPIERLEVLPQVAMCMACQRVAQQD